MSLTLQDYRNRPQTQSLDFSGVTVAAVSTELKALLNKKNMVQSEVCAIEFYLKNAVAAHIQQTLESTEVIPDPLRGLLDSYYRSIDSIGLRVFYYLLLICTRETRHAGVPSNLQHKMEKWGTLAFWNSIKGAGSGGAAQAVVDHPPEVSLLTYTAHLELMFSEGKYSSSYGGPKWAAVAKPLRQFVHGEISMEMLLDVAWTLAHNGGPIFNKGMLFNQFDHHELIKILDVQRAGLIPSLVREKASTYVKPTHQEFLMNAVQGLPGFGSDPLDWQKVMALGAKVNYGPKISKMKPKPMPNVPSSAESMFETDLKDMIQITPLQSVKKITRKEVHS